MLRKLFGANSSADDAKRHAHNATLAYIFDHSDAAFMIIDNDFVITYVNESTMTILREHREHFETIWHDFDPERIVGTCIDRFHADPSHQRSMMAQPMQQPFKTRISVGELTFALKVTALFDVNGEYNGNALEWINVTEEILSLRRDLEQRGQIDAISAAQAVISFDLEGNILHANDNFCQVMGYALSEIVGRHHRMFVDPDYATSDEYAAFWAQMRTGESSVGEYPRVAKDGSRVWIRGNYAPIRDETGKLVKVIKSVDDITADKQLRDEINAALVETASVMKGVADGDLTQRIEGNYSDTVAELKRSVNETLATLCTTIAEINRVAETVGTGASEISQGNNNLSRRTEEQATSLEQTASSMEQMTATVKRNADNAAEANTLSIDVHDQAGRGGDVVKRAVDGMQEISQSSGKIADIISVIDEIAFQTNLLALNASVEAARAGEQGRGFAVVASEVRNLAGRSATAAKEIKELIQDSATKVKEGSRLVNQSGETLQVIVDGIRQVAEIVGEIASASAEQSIGITQVNTAIGQMDDLTQQNAALVEQAAAAGESLSDQAHALSDLVRKFTVPSEVMEAAAVSSQQPERRSASRPWADRSASAPHSDNVITEPIAAVGDGDEIWEEF
ncbi:MAG: methyl-accepting chemotaxis protein [Pseudomonadota bacterium]